MKQILKIEIPYLYLILALLGLFYSLQFYNLGILDPDEFIFATSAWRFYYGEVPFKDFYTRYPGGYELFNLILFKIFGIRLVSMRYGHLVLFTTLPLCIYYISRQIMSKFYAVVSALFLTVLLGPYSCHPQAYNTWFFFLSMTFLFLAINHRWNKIYLFLTGVAVGLSITFRQNGGLVASLFVFLSLQYLKSKLMKVDAHPPKNYLRGFWIFFRLILILIFILPFAYFILIPEVWIQWYPISLTTILVLGALFKKWVGKESVKEWLFPNPLTYKFFLPDLFVVLGVLTAILPLSLILFQNNVLRVAFRKLIFISRECYSVAQNPFLKIDFATLLILVILFIVPLALHLRFKKNKHRFVIYLILFCLNTLLAIISKIFLKISIGMHIEKITTWMSVILVTCVSWLLIKEDRIHFQENKNASHFLMILLLAAYLFIWFSLPSPSGYYLIYFLPGFIILGAFYLDRLVRKLKVEKSSRDLIFLQWFSNSILIAFFFVFLIFFGKLRGFFDPFPVEGKKYPYSEFRTPNVPTIGLKIIPSLAEEYEEVYGVIHSTSHQDPMNSGDQFLFSPKRATLNFITLKKDPSYLNDTYLFLADPKMVNYTEVTDALEQTKTGFITVVNFPDKYLGDLYHSAPECSPFVAWEKDLPQELVHYIETQYNLIYQKGCYHIFKRRFSS